MVPVVTIAQSKGGAGKTTLVLALASEFSAQGGSVIILDADRQNSIVNWYRDREAAGSNEGSLISVMDVSLLRDADIGKAIQDASQQASLVLVDSEGTSNMKTAYASQDSNFVVIPTRSSRLDLERTVETTEMLNRMAKGVPFKVLLTQMQTAARSRSEIEIDDQIIAALPTFQERMFQLDAFRMMTNFRMTLDEISAANPEKAKRARGISQSILQDILITVQETANV